MVSKHKRIKWDVDEGHSLLWVPLELAKSLLGSMESKTGIKFTKHMFYMKGHSFKWCTLEKENERVGRFLVEKFKNKKFSCRFIKEYEKFYKKTVKRLNRLDKTDFSKISDSRLFRIFEKTTEPYVENFDFGFIAEPMDFVLPGLIEPRLIKKGYTAQEVSDALAIADISFLNRHKQALIKIAKAPREKQSGMIAKHAYEYRWLQTVHTGVKDIPLCYFEEEITELKQKNLDKELRFLRNFKKDVIKTKNELLKKKPVDNETRQLLAVAELIGPPHDMRKELFMRLIYTLDSLRGEIAKRYGYTWAELSVFETKDIVKLKAGKKLDKQFAHDALKECLVYLEMGKKGLKKRVFTGEKARKLMEKELALDVKNINEIKGMCASVGYAKGPVKIISGIGDLHKMEKGDILVASMTRPEHMPAIKKAAAIIADEGGVTCHAAITSREFGIPCIIGAKIAMRVLKDKDIVEVDANEGLIKLLKRSDNQNARL